MNAPNNPPPDPLNAIGLAILNADTRWVIIAAAVFVGLYIVLSVVCKKGFVSRDGAVTVSLALLQLYSAAALLGMLVLTEPPAFGLISNFQRQGAGFLAFMFLVYGVFMQLAAPWRKDPKQSEKNEGGGAIGGRETSSHK